VFLFIIASLDVCVLIKNAILAPDFKIYVFFIYEQATKMMFRLVEQISDKEGVTEQLKAENFMLWVG